jgi:hypothetical protein
VKSMVMLRRLVVGGALLLAAAVSSAKTPVQTLDDMPRHTYQVAGSVSAMLADPAAFGAFCASVRADIESDLATYEIGDKTARQRLLNTLLSLDLQAGRDADVPDRVEAVRALEDKEATRLTTGLVALGPGSMRGAPRATTRPRRRSRRPSAPHWIGRWLRCRRTWCATISSPRRGGWRS